MPESIVDRAEALARNIRAARRTGPLKATVADFIELLEAVPDGEVGQVAAASLGQLTVEADHVIDKIEEWINGGRAEGRDEQRLALAVYQIRAAIEEIDHWRRHYQGT
jgi:hypothetical protein